MRTFPVSVFFLLFPLLLAGFASAQATVTGQVVDAEGEALAGASVVLREAASGHPRHGTVTDPEGRFTLANVAEGTYRLEVRYLGYAPHTQRLVVDGSTTVAVQLSALAVSAGEVVVAANRAEAGVTPITFSNLSARELEVQPAMKDLPVHLATLPSITYYSENGNGIGYSYLRMRGFGQRRLAVAINGIPQNDPEEFNVFWINFFDLQNAVEDIQVQRGASSAFYGPTAIGGAINIVATPYKPYPYAQVELGYGAYDTQRYAVEANTGLLGGQYVAFGRVSRLLSDGYRDWSWTEFWRFFAGVTRYGDRSTLTLQAYGGPQRDGLAYIGISKADNDDEAARRANFSAFTEDVEDFHQPHVELLHDWQISDAWKLHQALFWVKGEGYFDFDGSFRSADYLRLPAGTVPAGQAADPLFLSLPGTPLLFRAYLDQWQVGWMPRVTYTQPALTATLGAEARLHRSLRWGRIQEAGAAIPANLVGDNDVRVYSVRGEKVIGSLYGSFLLRPRERLAVQADVQGTFRQYRIYDEAFFGTSFRKPYFFVNPRLGITLNPEQPLSAYASIAFANREPRMKTHYDGEEAGSGFQPLFEKNADGSFDFDAPLVKPERLLDLELGGRWQAERFRLAANVYWMEFWDELVPSGGLDQFGVPRTGNADRTRHVGLELEGGARLLRGLDLYANATFSRNRFIAFTEFITLPDFSTAPAVRDDNPIAGFPDVTANGRLTYRRYGLTASLNAKYASTQYIDNSGGRNAAGVRDEGFEVDPYVLLNASLQYTFGSRTPLQGLRLSVDVNNVWDSQVLLFGNAGFGAPQFFPAATRHLFFGVQYTLR